LISFIYGIKFYIIKNGEGNLSIDAYEWLDEGMEAVKENKVKPLKLI
jgi:hypothetical protein